MLYYDCDQLHDFYGRCVRNVVARIGICVIIRRDLYNPITVANQGSHRIMTLKPLFWRSSVHLCLGISFFEN